MAGFVPSILDTPSGYQENLKVMFPETKPASLHLKMVGRRSFLFWDGLFSRANC